MFYKNITELVGNTPMLNLSQIEKNNNLQAKLFAKLEYFNPAGSIKDRVALSMIISAQKEGKLKTISQSRDGNPVSAFLKRRRETFSFLSVKLMFSGV